MEITTLTAFLSPFLPALLGLGGKAVDKATESAAGKFGEAAFAKAQAIWGKLSPKVEAKEAAKEAAINVANNPSDRTKLVLEVQLKKLLEQDEELMKAIIQILEEDAPDGTFGTKIEQNVTGNNNQVFGTVSGSNVFSNIKGDVVINQPVNINTPKTTKDNPISTPDQQEMFQTNQDSSTGFQINVSGGTVNITPQNPSTKSPSELPNNNSAASPQIQQNVDGDRNQVISQVLGGMVVYGTVIYNNPTAEPDSATAQTKDPQIGANPYKGLLAFQETDGDRFFGRDLQINELWEKFRSLHEQESAARLLTIYGPSGSGKSSLARAGLIPELARQPLPGGERARVAVLVPGSHPLESLATVLARIATNDLTPVSKTREFATELAQANTEGIYDGLRRIADALPEITISPLIVMVDQLEEVFTLCEDPQERDAFIGNLLCAVANRSKRVSAIFTLRSDFIGATQKHPLLNQLIAAQGYLVAAMSEDGLREAITKPAELAGHPLDLSTVNLLIEQTADREGALPLLQFALSQIWVGLEKGKEPAKTLKAIGGVGGALAGEAQRIYENLSAEEQKIARQVFLALVLLGEGTKDTRRRITLDRVVSHGDSLEQVQKVIGRFASPSTRLITLANDDGTKTAEVTHEALFDNWQQLKDWLNGGRSDLRFQRRLDDAVMIWQENGRPEGNLWRSPDLDLLRRYQERAGDVMTQLQLDFFNASSYAETAQKEAENRQVQREKNIGKGIVVGSLVAVAVSSGFGWIAWKKTQQAEINLADSFGVSALSLVEKGEGLNAFVKGMRAGKILQNQQISNPSVLNALQEALNHRSEYNRLEGHQSPVYSVSFSPDGQTLASGSGDKTIKLWNLATGKEIRTLQGHQNQVFSVSFSPDGQTLASGSGDKTIKLWNLATGKEIRTLQGHQNQVSSVSFSPDGQTLASGSVDKTIKIWNLATGKEIRTIQGHQDIVYSMSFSPDGQTLASGSVDKTIKVWNLATGKEIRILQGHQDIVYSMSFSPDGQTLASSSGDKTIKIWNLATGKEIRILQGHQNGVNSMSFSPDGQILASGSGDKTIKIWNLATGKEIRILQGHQNGVNSMSFSPDGQILASGSDDKTIKIWNLATGKETRILQGHQNEVNSMSFSPDGQTLASGSWDKTIKIWNLSTRKEIRILQGHQNEVNSVSFSPDGQTLASGSGDKTIKLWNLATGKEIHTLQGHQNKVNSVSFSPDGQTLASGSVDKTIKIWNLAPGKEIRTLQGHQDSVFSVSFSPDGQTLASGSWDKTIKIWNLATGKEILTLQGYQNQVFSVSFSPNGQTLASGSGDKTIKLWNLSTGKEIRTLQGHQNSVLSVSFSPDGQTLASGSWDKTIKIWNLATSKEIRTLQGHQDSVFSVSFSPDGQTLASGSWDKTIKLWNRETGWDLDALMGRSCDWVRPYLLNNINVSESDKHLCDGIVTKKQ
jgi:WD40 repeat protein